MVMPVGRTPRKKISWQPCGCQLTLLPPLLPHQRRHNLTVISESAAVPSSGASLPSRSGSSSCLSKFERTTKSPIASLIDFRHSRHGGDGSQNVPPAQDQGHPHGRIA
ncbi:hypothetical protein MAPG_11333 [Magnaporthiopsis poae ATCC 64411]|uniref:Uncharacterized protein n=1 Tax=Magnaporthiopsis poae (strain ATCC 64411 / 73-15) TaxID=644358 RepID=A0A0C4EF00_MAGP6|nr:hypothetical protein MAPG_11333 [Magnaporthiopsis poae ATCC 64411]